MHRYKREKKGALREIRKDRDFLAKIKIKQQLKRFVLPVLKNDLWQNMYDLFVNWGVDCLICYETQLGVLFILSFIFLLQ